MWRLHNGVHIMDRLKNSACKLEAQSKVTGILYSLFEVNLKFEIWMARAWLMIGQIMVIANVFNVLRPGQKIISKSMSSLSLLEVPLKILFICLNDWMMWNIWNWKVFHPPAICQIRTVWRHENTVIPVLTIWIPDFFIN